MTVVDFGQFKLIVLSVLFCFVLFVLFLQTCLAF